LFGGDIIENCGVVDVSDVEIVEDVVSVVEPDLTGSEVSLKERCERIVERLSCSENTQVTRRIVVHVGCFCLCGTRLISGNPDNIRCSRWKTVHKNVLVSAERVSFGSPISKGLSGIADRRLIETLQESLSRETKNIVVPRLISDEISMQYDVDA